MTLAIGTRLGPHEILAPIGAGGMGEVYRARDTRLDRIVAIKVLPEHFAANLELKQRFEREAKAISQLTHPHICTLYDVGNEGGVEYLVMEFLEGESLAQRLENAAIPPAQVISYGIEIADALEKAHRGGIIHRDLKPGNIMITKSGIKLLDFGLAKIAAPTTVVAEMSSLPTEGVPSQPLTERGTVMGTFQYMAPEQIEGSEADARTDIFAFGCVLYEMATGRKAFTGKSRVSLIGAILKDEPPPISSIQLMTPPALDRLVQTCLAKEPEDRFQTAHDVKLQLQWIAEGGSQAGAPAIVVSRRKTREKLAWGLSALLFLATLILGVGYLRRAPAPAHPVRFQIPPPDGLSVVGSPRLSPDGKFIAFSATDVSGKTQIWLRPFESLEVRPMPGTDGAALRPFWSPDSRFIAFVAGGKLKKIDLSGAPPQTICDASSGADGSWGKEGVILFDGATSDPIKRVPASGGVAQDAVKLDLKAGVANIGWPEFLPDGRHFLYLSTNTKSESQLMVASLEGSQPPRALVSAASRVQYVEPGYLLFVREGTLVAQPFDAGKRKLSGEPIPLSEKMSTSGGGLADFSAAGAGVLIYRGGESTDSRLVWVDRSGKEISEAGKPSAFNTTALSPDGNRLAFDLTDAQSGKRDIWIRDLKRGVSSRFTFDPSNNNSPLWSSDGSRIVFASDRKGAPSLYQKAASGTGPEEELFSCGERLVASDWSRDGRYIAVNRLSAKTSFDIWIVPADGKSKPFPFLHEPYSEVLPSFSPDGRFIAYMSNESKRMEIFVQQFPGPGGKWQVSTDGGVEPHWSADGKEIFYLSPDRKIMSVAVEAGPGFTVSIPKPLFDARIQPGQRRNSYLVSRDGKEFLLLSPLSKERMQPITVVLNWAAALRAS
jgi:Tol biopolymer transport system component